MIEKIIAWVLAALISAFAGGCASLPASPTSMSPEQLREYVKIKDANVVCVVVNSPWGKQTALFLNLDKGVIVSGTVNVKDGCETVLTNAPALPK
jgi:hypothetical protein